MGDLVRMVLEFPRPALGDGVVLLRVWSEADRSSMVEALNDVEYRRHGLSRGGRYPEQDARQFLLDQAQEREAGDAISLAVVDATVPASVTRRGRALRRRSCGGAGGSGVLDRAVVARGGIATRSARLLVQWAHEALGLVRVELTCGPGNLASQRAAERAGFVREGLSRPPGPRPRRPSAAYVAKHDEALFSRAAEITR